MKPIGLPRQLACFLGATTLLVLCVVVLSGLLPGIVPGLSYPWLLDVLTSLVAAGIGVPICARLALGTPNARLQRVWQALLVISILVAVAQFTGSRWDRIGDVGNCLLLALVPLLLFVSTRSDPLPPAAQRLLWLALAAQVLATAADLLDDGTGFIQDRALWQLAADFGEFLAVQFYLLAAAIHVASLRRQIFHDRRLVGDLGDRARYLFSTYRLIDRYRYPRFAGRALPIGTFPLAVAQFLDWFGPTARPVKQHFGVGYRRQLRDIGVLWFRHGLDAQAYYLLELYRPERFAQAAGYLTRYETKNGLLKHLTWQIGISGRRSRLGDKLAMAQLWQRHDLPCIPHLAIARDGAVERGHAPFERDLFLKPYHSKGARGTLSIRYIDGRFVPTDTVKAPLTEAQLIELITERSRGDILLVQPRIENHLALADLADQSLIVIRIITCLDATGRPRVTHGMLRVLAKLEPEWPSDAELGSAVDLHTGTLGPMTGDKRDMLFSWFDFHPFTGVKVTHRQVPYWDAACKAAMAAHAVSTDRLIIGWDIAIAPEGPLLVEGNAYPDVDFLQRVHRCSIGASPLGPLLAPRIDALEARIART